MKNEIRTLKCVICGKEFETNCPDKKYCSKSCFYRRRTIDNRNKRIEEYLKNGIEGEDYIIDRWNGLPCARMYGSWMKTMHPGRTIEEYRKEFPNEPVACRKDLENTNKGTNNGEWMKTDEARKLFSDKFRGENNPRHHSKVSDQEEKESSPFSKEFYKKRGYSEEEATKMALDFSRKVQKSIPKEKNPTNVEYYISKYNVTEEEARKMLAERQRTFTLEKCIQKYGKEKGEQIYNERQEKWIKKVFNKDSCISTGTSMIANNFINEIISLRGCEDNLLYGKNELFIYDNEAKACYRYDLTNTKTKKIIEFNGDYWHGNPLLYNKDKVILQRHGKTASDIWEKDRRKLDTANKNGYELMTVWESDYKKDKQGTIKKSLLFLDNA